MDAAQNQGPPTGRLKERVYGNQHKHICPDNRRVAHAVSEQFSQSLERLSSGSKINSPADDSAGLAVSMGSMAQMGNNTAASGNVADAISFNQTQDGYLQQVSTALDRMSELAVQAQDVTKSDSDRSCINRSSARWPNTSTTWPRRTSTASACSMAAPST